jgi:conjugal transfer/type IV secretion protein DotA/TraY
MSLLPQYAMAATGDNLFDLASDDKSLMVLRAMFGGLGPFGAGADPFGEGIKVFNGCVLIIGGLLVAYTIIIGTVGTAHDGEMLGKKFSSVWIPIRTALGTALVLPIINGTYCTMQFIVGWLIVQGVGLADVVWDKYTAGTNMSFLTSSGTSSASSFANGSARTLGYNLFQSLVCMEAITKVNEDIIAAGAKEVVSENQVGKQTVSQYDPNTYNFGAFPEANGLLKDSCGTLTMPQNVVNPSTGIGSSIEQAELYPIAQKITLANQTATTKLIADLDALAKTSVTDKKVITGAQIDAAIATYQNTVNQAAATEISNLPDFKTLAKNASKDGWYMAGAFYTKMTWFADTVHRATANVGSTTPPNPQAFSTASMSEHFQKYGNLLAETSKTSPDAMNIGFGINQESGTQSADGSDKLLAKIFKWNPITLDKGEHPLMALKRIGNWMLSIYVGVIAAAVALSGASAGWGTKLIGQALTLGAFDPEKALTTAVSFIQPLVTPLLAVGMVLSYVLPMMPFFLWFGATLGWLVMCIEAILAAPMWAVMHLTANGDDMVGSGSQGYRLVLSLVLRPVLMIFGLIASFVIIQVMGEILTEIFFGAFVGGQSDSNLLIKFIGYVLIAPLLYGWTMFVLIKKAFSMIHVIPEELLKWFGGAASGQLGDFANTVGGEGAGAAAGAAILAQQGGAIGGKLLQDSNAKLQGNVKDVKGAAKEFADLTGKEQAPGIAALPLQQRMAVNSKLKSGQEKFGGAESHAGQAYTNAFNQSIADGDSSETALQKANDAGLNATYGAGTSDFVNAMEAESAPSGGGGGEHAEKLLSNKYGKLSKAGLSHPEITDTLKSMIEPAMKQHTNKDNDAPLFKLVAKESNRVNKEMALGVGAGAVSDIQSKVDTTKEEVADKAPPEPPKPVDTP